MRTEALCQVEKLQIYPTQQGALKRCIWWYHLIAEFWECPFDTLAEAKTVEKALKSALNFNGKKRDIHAISYQFQPFGVSAQVNSGTAQIYIHTWPENGYGAIDILAESKEDAYKILKKLQENLKPKNIYIAEIARGISEDRVNGEGGET